MGHTQPSSHWVLGGSFREAKRTERGAEHSLRSTAEVRNARICTFTEWCLTKLTVTAITSFETLNT